MQTQEANEIYPNSVASYKRIDVFEYALKKVRFGKGWRKKSTFYEYVRKPPDPLPPPWFFERKLGFLSRFSTCVTIDSINSLKFYNKKWYKKLGDKGEEELQGRGYMTFFYFRVCIRYVQYTNSRKPYIFALFLYLGWLPPIVDMCAECRIFKRHPNWSRLFDLIN